MNKALEVCLSLIRRDGELVECLEKLPSWEIAVMEKEVLQSLHWNRLIPVFYETITRLKLQSFFSSAFLEEVKQNHYQNSLRSMQLEGTFRTIVPLLQKYDITVIVLKGIYLSHRVYHHPSLRPMGDVDFLVKKRDVAKTRDVLLQAGCLAAYESESKHTTGRWQHMPPLVYRNIPIEIHHHLFHAHKELLLPGEQLWGKAIPISICGQQCLTLAPEHQLFYLISHLHNHALQGYIRLIWMLDIRLFWELNQQSINTSQLNGLLQRARLTEAFHAIQDILSIRIIAPQPSSSDIEARLAFYLSRCNPTIKSSLRLTSIMALQDLDGIGSKGRFIFGKLFPVPAYIKAKYKVSNNFMIPVFYLLRYKEYLQKLWKVMFRKYS